MKELKKLKNIYEDDKIPPQSIDLEEAILGAIILEPQSLDAIIRYYTPDVFYLEAHKNIFKAILSLKEENSKFDLLLVIRRLKEMDLLESCGGQFYIAQLARRVVSASNIDKHARIVFQDYIRRVSIKKAYELQESSFDISFDVFDLIDKYKESYEELANSIDTPEIISGDLVNTFIENVVSNTPPTSSLFIKRSIGIPSLDKIVSWSPNKLLVFAGSSKDGKTKLASYIAWQLLRSDKSTSVYWVTLEDSPNDILASFCSSKALVKPKDIIQRKTSSEDRFKIMEATDEFKTWDIEFVSESTSILNIKIKFEIFCNRRPDRFNVLIIDNLLSLSDKYKYTHNPNAFYDTIYGNIADIRRDTKGFIILLHHFKDEYNDESNIETGFRPKITDAKGSEANHRVPNYMFLINNPSKKKALLNKYEDKKRFILERLMILDPVVIRDEDNTGDKTLIRLYSNLNYNIFKDTNDG
jgi:replicative DNA helicase